MPAASPGASIAMPQNHGDSTVETSRANCLGSPDNQCRPSASQFTPPYGLQRTRSPAEATSRR